MDSRDAELVKSVIDSPIFQTVVAMPALNFVIATFNSPKTRQVNKAIRVLIQVVIVVGVSLYWMYANGYWSLLTTENKTLACIFMVFATSVTYKILRDNGVSDWESYTTQIGEKFMTSASMVLRGGDSEVTRLRKELEDLKRGKVKTGGGEEDLPSG